MTLVLALASEHEIHMTCDFRLTYIYPRNRKPDDDVHKLIQVSGRDFQAIVGVTGFAILDRTPIGAWVAQRTSQLGFDGTLDDLLEVLRGASEPLSRVQTLFHKHRELTFLVGAIQGSQSVLCMLSNVRNLRGRLIGSGEIPGHELFTDVTRPSRAQLFAAGSGAKHVHDEEKKSLEWLLRSGLAAPERIRHALAQQNRQVAARTKDVSEGCYAATQLATGHGQTQPFLIEQTGYFNPPSIEEMLKRAGLVLIPKTLPDGSPAPIQMDSSSSASYRPSPEYFREQFKLRPDDSELWNNFGVYEQQHGRVDKAVAAYEKALELDVENAHAAGNLENIRNLGAAPDKP
jgi:hypothetical protein